MLLSKEELYYVEVRARDTWEVQGHPFLSIEKAEKFRAQEHAKYGETRIICRLTTVRLIVTHTGR